jgi:hypothetical protein
MDFLLLLDDWMKNRNTAKAVPIVERHFPTPLVKKILYT